MWALPRTDQRAPAHGREPAVAPCPDLSVLWSVLERDVRSDSQTAGERERDEDLFSSDVRQQNQPVARGIRQLGPSNVRVRLLRDKVPFTVLTDASFPSLKVLGERLLGRLGLQGYSSVEATSGREDPRGGGAARQLVSGMIAVNSGR